MLGWRLASIAVLVVVVVSGCNDGAETPSGFPTSRDSLAFTQQDVAALLELGGMSAEQREIVERSGKTGVVTFDDYQQAVMANIDCLKDAALNPHDVETSTAGGQPQILYVVGSNPKFSEAVNDDLMSACARENSDAVVQLYSHNPGATQRAVEVQDKVFAADVTACLTNAGYDLSDAPGHTWRDLAGKVLYEQTDNSTVLCILDTGIAEAGLNLPIPEGE